MTGLLEESEPVGAITPTAVTAHDSFLTEDHVVGHMWASTFRVLAMFTLANSVKPLNGPSPAWGEPKTR
eukprot:4181407-Heterocapsa_arctica.AAC.1